tara:strand:- start:174995 stop:175330 length:336 start_codon:yes stop_codon:yes gene_type:complete
MLLRVQRLSKQLELHKLPALSNLMENIMEVVKQTDEYTVIKKRSGRFGVKNAAGKWINGEEKVKILVAEGLIKAAVPAEKPAEEAEAPAEEAQAAPADEAPAEEATAPAAE